MENKQIYEINNEKFKLKNYGDLTWEEDELLVNSLNAVSDINLDINGILSIVLEPIDKRINVKTFDFKRGRLSDIKKIIKEDIIKGRNDFLAVWQQLLMN